MSPWCITSIRRATKSPTAAGRGTSSAIGQPLQARACPSPSGRNARFCRRQHTRRLGDVGQTVGWSSFRSTCSVALRRARRCLGATCSTRSSQPAPYPQWTSRIGCVPHTAGQRGALGDVGPVRADLVDPQVLCVDVGPDVGAGRREVCQGRNEPVRRNSSGEVEFDSRHRGAPIFVSDPAREGVLAASPSPAAHPAGQRRLPLSVDPGQSGRAVMPRSARSCR